MPNQNNKTGQKSLFIKGLKIYNSVPEAIKSEQASRNVFKKRVIQYIKERIPITPRAITYMLNISVYYYIKSF